jgi:hypothetical protein
MPLMLWSIIFVRADSHATSCPSLALCCLISPRYKETFRKYFLKKQLGFLILGRPILALGAGFKTMVVLTLGQDVSVRESPVGFGAHAYNPLTCAIARMACNGIAGSTIEWSTAKNTQFSD